MKNVKKAYENAKKLLALLGVKQKEEWWVNHGFDDEAECLTRVAYKDGDFGDVIAIFKVDGSKELCIGDELTYMSQNEINELASAKDPEVLIELCGYPLRDLGELAYEERESKTIKDSYNPFVKSNANKVIRFFNDIDGSAIDVEDALEVLDIDTTGFEYIDDLSDEVLSKVYYFLKREYQKDVDRFGEDADIPEAAYDIFDLNDRKPSIDAKKLEDELLDALLDFYRFNNDIDLDTAKVHVRERSNDCLRCVVQTDLDQENLKKLTKKLNPIVQRYDKNAHFDISIYPENDGRLVTYVWRE